MGFSQVVEDNGVKKLVPITTSSSVTAQEAKILASEAKALAENALPLDGSKAMTGNLMQTAIEPRLQQKLSGTSKDTPPAGRVTGGYNVFTEDASPNQLGGLGVDYNTDQTRTAFMQAVSADASASARISAILGSDGTSFATAPHPRPDNYSFDVVTTLAMKDFAPQKLGADAVLWVNEQTGSDTANLYEGRGFSAAMPFQSLLAAVAWVCANMSGNSVTINLASDITLPSGLNVACSSIGTLIINAQSRTVHLGGPISVHYGKLAVKHGKYVADTPIRSFMYAAGLSGCNPVLSLEGDIELQGAVNEAAVMAAYEGTVIMNIGNTLTGNVTGKRYRALNGGHILVGGRGEEAIPGTIDGTVDAVSIYA